MSPNSHNIEHSQKNAINADSINVSDLHLDILEYILTYINSLDDLKNLSLVSLTFHSLVYSKLWSMSQVNGDIESLHELENFAELPITQISLSSSNRLQNNETAIDIVGNLTKNRCLRHLRLNRNAMNVIFNLNSPSISSIHELSIRQLDIAFCDADNQTMSAVSKLPSLETLNISHNQQVSDTGLKYLSTMKKLKSLDLRFCWRISPVGLSHLCNTNCQEIYLTHGGVDTDCINAISQMKELRKLYIRDNLGIQNESLIHLLKLGNLKLLDIRGCDKINESGVHHFRKSKIEIVQ